MTHDVFDNVARLMFLLYASCRHYFYTNPYNVIPAKWSKSSYTGRIRTYHLTAATRSKIVRNFLKI